MIVSIHQPHFLPWIGYFNKVWGSDVFVWLHNVQYRKNYFQSRTKVKNPQTSQEFWLTVPVSSYLGIPIDQLHEANTKWRKTMCKTIEQFYRRAPFFSELGPELLNRIEMAEPNLDRLNFGLFMFVLDRLGYSGKVKRVEDLLPLSEEPNLRLIEICKKIGGDTYVAGKGGRNYLNLDQWNSAGIGIVWQEFRPVNLTYRQLGNGFIPGLSIVDCLFCEGVERTRELVSSAWRPGA